MSRQGHFDCFPPPPVGLYISCKFNAIKRAFCADVTVGGWMLAMNVTHLDDRRMCDEHCGPATVAVYDIPQCAGLCDAPKSLPLLHADPKCRTPPLDPRTGTLPTLEPYFWFVKP